MLVDLFQRFDLLCHFNDPTLMSIFRCFFWCATWTQAWDLYIGDISLVYDVIGSFFHYDNQTQR